MKILAVLTVLHNYVWLPTGSTYEKRVKILYPLFQKQDEDSECILLKCASIAATMCQRVCENLMIFNVEETTACTKGCTEKIFSHHVISINLEALLNLENGSTKEFEKEILLPSMVCSTEKCSGIRKSRITNIGKSQNVIKVATKSS